MKHALVLGLVATIAILGLYHVVNLYDSTMKWSRMHNTPAVRPYEEPMLIMEEGLVPFNGGEMTIRSSLDHDADYLQIQSDKSTIEKGESEYKAFCSHCHGISMDGMGPVGQSFNPLPTNLLDQRVIQMSDSQIFSHISYGGKQSPALASSMSLDSRKAVISYIRSKQANK